MRDDEGREWGQPERGAGQRHAQPPAGVSRARARVGAREQPEGGDQPDAEPERRSSLQQLEDRCQRRMGEGAEREGH